MSVFHKLTVDAVRSLTDDACSVQFAVPERLRTDYAFHPGQHLTLRRVSETSDERRTYSICSTPAELAEHGLLRIGVKRISGGLFSSWLNGELAVGDIVEVLTPAGRFGAGTGTSEVGLRIGCLAAGSGITPMMSIIASTLTEVPDSEVCLVYGNRTSNDVMFLEELADLKNRFPSRLTLLHVLSGEPQLSDLLTGRIDADKLGALLAGLAANIEQWYLCGPFGMVSAAREALVAGGITENRIHAELFFVGEQPYDPPPAAAGHDEADRSEVTVTLAGRTSTVLVGYTGPSILDAVLATRPDAPYACKGGVCGTCRARLTDGEVSMSRNYALEPDELAAGLVLACQSHPVSDTVALEFL